MSLVRWPPRLRSKTAAIVLFLFTSFAATVLALRGASAQDVPGVGQAPTEQPEQRRMGSSASAIWSAVAASFAALSSFLIMLIQRRNLLESVRPELVLSGWSRNARGNPQDAFEVLSIQTVRNVGRGVALNIIIWGLHQEKEKRPTAVLATKRIPTLAPNETQEVNAEIVVFWKNVDAGANGLKFLPINTDIVCWDSRGMRHDTRYGLFAAELSANIGFSDELAPGLSLSSRTTVSRPVWWLKMLRRAPWLARILHEET